MWLMFWFFLNANTQTNALQVIGGNRTVVQGQTVTFNCKLVDATETLAQISWQRTTRVKKNNDFLTVLQANGPVYVNGRDDRIKFIGSFNELNGSFRISNVSLEDEGIYTCIFTLFPSGTHNTRIHLDVLVPPVIRVKDNLPTLADKEVCIATCTAAGSKPPASVSWLTGSLADKLRATANSTHHDDGKTTTVSYLFGVPTIELHQQVVHCVVTSPALSQEEKKTFTIQVNFAPREVKICKNPKEDSFQCETDANPKAEFNWTRVDKAWPQSGVRVEGGTLQFLTRSSELNGLYQCTAFNQHGRSSVYIFRSGISDRSNAGSTPVRPSTIPQADCSPSCSDGLPVISNVVSLSKSRLRKKRERSVSPPTTAKRSLANDFLRNISDTPTSVDMSAPCSPSEPVGETWDDDTDEDIFLLEDASTPKPKDPCFALTKVKIEPDTDAGISMVLDGLDDVAVESETNTAGESSTGSLAVGADPSPAPPPKMTSTNTQTEAPKVKKEEEDPNHTEGNGVAGPSASNVNGVEHISCACCNEEGVIKQESEASQTLKTEETVEGIDYKSMFEMAKEKVDELIKEKEALLAATEREPSRDQGEEKASDEIALQVDSLMRELDQKHVENERLKAQNDLLHVERQTLAEDCQELRLMLQQQRGNAGEGSTTQRQNKTDSSAQTDTEEAAGATVAGGDSSSDTFRSLIELRQNVGRLLITSIPALSLDQVNFECNVIDEILEQFLSERDTIKEEEQWN